MKKLLTFVLTLSIVASTCLYAQAVKKNKPKADEPETLLFYGQTQNSHLRLSNTVVIIITTAKLQAVVLANAHTGESSTTITIQSIIATAVWVSRLDLTLFFQKKKTKLSTLDSKIMMVLKRPKKYINNPSCTGIEVQNIRQNY